MVGRISRAALVLSLAVSIALLVAQGEQTSPTVGEGSPNSTILGLFLQAFARGTFSTQVALPAASKVHRDGPGYVQTFSDVNTTTNFTFALVKPDSLEAAVQMCCQIYALHQSIGSFISKIGYPLADPIAVQSPIDGAVGQQQSFEGGHAIIAYQSGELSGQTFFIRDPFVSKWRVTSALGLPTSLELNATSVFTTTGVQQNFQGGVIVQITSGARQDQVYVVSGTIFRRYNEISGTASWLGFPIADELLVSGRIRQTFEGGVVEYVPGSAATAEARAPVVSVTVDAAPLTLQVGNVITRTAAAFDARGTPITDRPAVWTTSNRSVVQVEASGSTATLRAVGPGFANIVAYVDGISSGTLRITVTSACCQVGEGAPTPAIRQAMQDALSRNGITPRLPADGGVRRAGAGYAQEFLAATPANLGRVLVLKADNTGLGYVVTGERLVRYLELGGPAGVLGFPTVDANAAGRQAFENEYLLAGSPPALIGSPLSQKWAALGYETGVAGSPRSEATPAGPSPFGASGVAQVFANGVILGHTNGGRAGQAFFVGGLILARYSRLSGPTGVLGLPVSDAAPQGASRTQQNFEGGSIDFAAGDAEAQERLAARTPAVTALPNPAPIGGRVRIAISGFAPGRRLLVTLGSTPEFEVTSANGAFSWDQQLRPGTAAGVYRILVRDPSGNESAETSYRVRTIEEVRYQWTKISGDNQSALVGSEAALPLVVRLTDEAGNGIAGARVLFGSVAGGATNPPETITDPDGYARARLRLPPAAGLVLATAEAANRIVTFAARAEEGRLTTFPTFRQGIDNLQVGGGPASIHQKGSLLTALAALFRYYQDRNELPAPSGLAEPAALNQFLTAGGYLPFTLNGRPELVVNLPRALGFVGDGADLETLAPEPGAIRDSVNLRRPVLLGLMLRSGDQDRGAHYVVATGVGVDGNLLIYDPSPDWNRTGLADYLTGFSALGRNWSGRLLHALRLKLEPRSRRGFLVHGAGPVPLRMASPGARQGYLVRIPALAAYDELVVDSGDGAQLFWVDGVAPQYQLNVGEGTTATVRGAAVVPSLAPGVYRIHPDPAAFSVTPQSLTATAEGLRNAAGFGARLALGSLASLFGSGLVEGLSLPPRGTAGTLGGLSVAVGGRVAPLLFALPFQANLQIPYELPPGAHVVEVTSPYGTARFEVSLDEAALGIFVIGATQAAVLNQDGSLNTTLNPSRRNTVLQVFVAGLGAVAPSLATGVPAPNSPLSHAVAEVTATLDGRPATVTFAGVAPGFLGLGQVNVLAPASFAPNAAAQLVLRAAGQDSNPVTVAVQ